MGLGRRDVQYKVVTVADQDLPEGTDWALARSAGAFYLFVRDGKLTPTLLNQTWPAFMKMVARQPVYAA